MCPTCWAADRESPACAETAASSRHKLSPNTFTTGLPRARSRSVASLASSLYSRRVKTAEVFLACILPAVSLGAFAAPPPYRVAPAPAWVMRAPDSLVTDHSKQLEAGESDFPIVDHQVRVAAATAHYERYVERVLNQEGVESAAQVSIEIDPEREQVLLHQIRVYRGGRFIDKLESSRRTLLNRESDLEDGLINGRVTLHVLLKDIRVGDVLDYSYTTERTDPVAERGYYEAFSTQWAAAVRYFRLRVLRPNDR